MSVFILNEQVYYIVNLKQIIILYLADSYKKVEFSITKNIAEYHPQMERRRKIMEIWIS